MHPDAMEIVDAFDIQQANIMLEKLRRLCNEERCQRATFCMVLLLAFIEVVANVREDCSPDGLAAASEIGQQLLDYIIMRTCVTDN